MLTHDVHLSGFSPRFSLLERNQMRLLVARPICHRKIVQAMTLHYRRL